MEIRQPSREAGNVQPAKSSAAEAGSAIRVGIRVDVALLALQPRAQSLPGQRYQFGVLVVPAEGRWQLPSAHLRAHEPVSVAAARAADDSFGLLNLTLSQLSVVEAAADTQGRVFSIGYFCGITAADADLVLDSAATRLALIDEASASVSVDGVQIELPAGQAELVAGALDVARNRYAHEPDPLVLLPDLFTLADLKDAHDAVFGEPRFSTDAFRRVMEPQLIIVGERKSGSVGRPAKVYRRLSPVTSRPVSSPVDQLQTEMNVAPDALESMSSADVDSAKTATEAPSTTAVSQPTSFVAPASQDTHARRTQAEVKFRNAAQRRWLDELLAFASASMSVSEDPSHPGQVRFTSAPGRTNERAIEQVLALVDKCQELFPQSFVDIYARRGTSRQRRIDLRTTKVYLPYSQALQQRLNELHDLASVAQVLIDIACSSPDQLLRFNVNQVLRDVQALEAMLEQTSTTGVVVHDVPDESGTVPTAAEMEIRSRVPVLLNMAGAEAMAFRTISDRLALLAEGTGSRVTRVAERIWFVSAA